MGCPASMQRTGTGNRLRRLRHQKVGHSENCEVKYHQKTLVGGLEHFLFFQILGIIIPTDELIFFRGVETTNQNMSDTFLCFSIFLGASVKEKGAPSHQHKLL